MNRLKNETSPYLLQHADNPVDWYPWGEEAFQKAQQEDKPILLSIGYSSCHWCHVMAHESFEDPAIAAIMNEHFINIKVDREERPDVDDIYMQATLVFTGGHGGWPMTVFLTPEGRPYHAGTYFPPVPRQGMPSFRQVLQAAVDAYQNKRDQLEEMAGRVTESLQRAGEQLRGQGTLDEDLLDHATRKLTARPDRIYGGLHTGQPKFPAPMTLEYLLRYHAATGDSEVLDIVTFTLTKMARGGIYDQIGGGFHRYSVDNKWLVPHFEKMLYDNAQLARLYLHAYQLTDNPFFEEVTRDILRYIEREMTLNLDDGTLAFYSSQDADTEGEEGKFFVWTPDEMQAVLADDFSEEDIQAVFEYYGITEGGNFEGKNIPNVEDDLSDVADWHNLSEADAHDLIQRARQLLFQAREERVKPGRDDKVLAAWNGMMLAAFAEAARALEDTHYQAVAQSNARFLLERLVVDEAQLFRTFKLDEEGGEVKILGYLEDYANVIDGLLALYQTDFAPQWFAAARQLADYAIEHFYVADEGAFYDTSDQHEALIARPRSVQDNATPSGNNLMAENLIRLAAYTGQHDYQTLASQLLGQLAEAMREYPSAFGVALGATQLLVHRLLEVAVIGDPAQLATQALLEVIQQPYRPRVITALAADDQGPDANPELLANRSQQDGAPTAYVCQNFTCRQPVTSPEALHDLLASQGQISHHA